MALVMVIDDDENIRETLCDVLEEMGHEHIAAANGQDALDKLAAVRRPCLVFLDLMMPVMSGREFLAAKAADGGLQGVAVVIVTASGTADVPGADAVLHKPVSLLDIETTVARYC